jgi:hypothetical protein
MNATTGRSNKYTDLSLPLIKGTKRAPTINIADGGIKLVIIVFVSLNKYAQQFCYKDKEDTGAKSVHCKKIRGPLPWKVSVLMNEEVNNKEHCKGYIKKD